MIRSKPDIIREPILFLIASVVVEVEHYSELRLQLSLLLSEIRVRLLDSISLTRHLYHISVAAIIQMGDPRHLINKSYDVGTSINNGLFPRLADQGCDHYASKIQAYCDFGDSFCDSGLNVLAHLDYIEKYNTDALAFVNKLLG